MSTKGTITYWSTPSMYIPYVCYHKYQDCMDNIIYSSIEVGIFRGTRFYAWRELSLRDNT